MPPHDEVKAIGGDLPLGREDAAGARWALASAGVSPAVEAQHVAKRRPQTLSPRGVGRSSPFSRFRHVRRGKMVERDVALDGSAAAVAASAGICSVLYHS